jgi:hypothetical protein
MGPVRRVDHRTVTDLKCQNRLLEQFLSEIRVEIAALLNVETNEKHLKKSTKRELIVDVSNKNSQLRNLLKAARKEQSDDQLCYNDFLIAELERLREIWELELILSAPIRFQRLSG